MGTISYAIPQTGQPDATEDPKVASALTALLTLVNGNLDTTNLASSAAIARAQIATGAAVPLTPAIVNANASVGVGQVLCVTAGSTTMTLPASPSTSDMVGVVAAAGSGTINGAAQVTVSAGANNILLPGGTGLGVTSFKLGTGFAFWSGIWTGANWATLSGGEDTGWVALTLGTNVVAGDNYTPSSRRVNGTVTLKGTLQASGSIGSGAVLATVPSGHRPPGASATPLATLVNNASAPVPVLCAANGQITATGNLTVNQQIPLNRVGYELNA